VPRLTAGGPRELGAEEDDAVWQGEGACGRGTRSKLIGGRPCAGFCLGSFHVKHFFTKWDFRLARLKKFR
jgi:hypothetical protein